MECDGLPSDLFRFSMNLDFFPFLFFTLVFYCKFYSENK